MSKIFFKASIVVWLNLPLSFYDNIPIILKKAPNLPRLSYQFLGYAGN